MQVLALAVAFLAVAGSAIADDCVPVCGAQCALADTICLLSPADEVCDATNKICLDLCNKGCGCLAECTSKCPTPAFEQGLAAVVGNSAAVGSTALCRTTCRASCGFELVTSATSQSISVVTQLATQFFGLGQA